MIFPSNFLRDVYTLVPESMFVEMAEGKIDEEHWQQFVRSLDDNLAIGALTDLMQLHGLIRRFE